MALQDNSLRGQYKLTKAEISDYEKSNIPWEDILKREIEGSMAKEMGKKLNIKEVDDYHDGEVRVWETELFMFSGKELASFARDIRLKSWEDVQELTVILENR